METLDRLFPSPAPFLSHTDPFTLLVAVILSQRCTDLKVNAVTPHLFAVAKTPEEICALDLATLQDIIRPCGLSSQKSHAIWTAANEIIKKYGGKVPRDIESLLSFPGVGRKTANVILSQAFNTPAFPVDTHILRLSARWGLSRSTSPAVVERDLCRIFPKSSWNKLHLQMILYGRTFCPAKKHATADCIICKKCTG